MKTFLIKNLEIQELDTSRRIIIESLDNRTISVVRENVDPLAMVDTKRVEVYPVHYYAPNGDEYFIASNPKIAEMLQFQIDEVFELCATRDQLQAEKNRLEIKNNKLFKKNHGLSERNHDLIQQVNKYNKMSFWKRLKFSVTGTCL